MITKDMLLEIAKKKGLTNKEYIEKDYFQDLFLFNLYKKTNLFIFKGGTCLYKIYNLSRFSEDLDFSLLRKTEPEKIVLETADKINGEIKDIKKMKNSLLIKIGFNGILTDYNTLRIDISLVNLVFKYEIKDYISPYIDINPFSLRVLTSKEMIAEKIHAILARNRARDLYDLFFLLRFTEPDWKIIDKKLEIFNMKFESKKFLEKINNLGKIWDNELRPFLLSELLDFGVVRNFVLEKSHRTTR